MMPYPSRWASGRFVTYLAVAVRASTSWRASFGLMLALLGGADMSWLSTVAAGFAFEQEARSTARAAPISAVFLVILGVWVRCRCARIGSGTQVSPCASLFLPYRFQPKEQQE